MNTPNKFTVARIILTPIFMFFALAEFIPYNFVIALVLFVAAAITDFIDGKLARKYNIVTNFGKFLDPLADKMLTTAALIAFLARGIGFGIVVILFITLFREFLVSSLRLVTVSSDGKVVAANIWGKAKTVTQMVAIIFGFIVEAAKQLLALPIWLNTTLTVMTDILLWLATVLCVISGITYLVECRSVIDPRK